MRVTEERRLLGRFMIVMSKILFQNDDSMPDFLKKVYLETDWESMQISPLRMATNDLLEMTGDITGADLEMFDQALSIAGAATLSNLRDKNYRKVIKLLAQKKIKNEVDLYLLKSVADNQDPKFSASQLKMIDEILFNSEQ